MVSMIAVDDLGMVSRTVFCSIDEPVVDRQMHWTNIAMELECRVAFFVTKYHPEVVVHRHNFLK